VVPPSVSVPGVVAAEHATSAVANKSAACRMMMPPSNRRSPERLPRV
jgi:hypothetical protein